MIRHLTKCLAGRGLAIFLGGMLASGQLAYGVSGSVSASAPAKQRVGRLAGGQVLPPAYLGAKTFSVEYEAAAALVVDENGVAPTSGVLTSIEVGSGDNCYAVALDSAAASGNTGATQVKALMPPIYASPQLSILRQYEVPLQFNRGLVLYVSNAGCRASVRWLKNGGPD